MSIFRTCICCKIDKPATEEFFYKDKNRPLGLMYRCKECDRNRKDRRSWEKRKQNFTDEQKERLKENKRKYNKTEAGKSRIHAASYALFDKTRGYENDIKHQDITNVKLEKCIYCGYPATGFDRIDNNLGHTKINCVPSCKECNIARMNNFTHEEMFVLGAAIKQVKDNR